MTHWEVIECFKFNGLGRKMSLWKPVSRGGKCHFMSWGNGNFKLKVVNKSLWIRLVWWKHTHQFSSVQLLSRTQRFATPWTAARQASLSITNSWSLLRLMSIESVMPSNHLILCRPLLLLPSIFPNIRVFSNESVFHIRWPNNTLLNKSVKGKKI